MEMDGPVVQEHKELGGLGIRLVAAAGGTLPLAEELPGALRGVGLYLIVVCLGLFQELLRNRPPVAPTPKGK